LLGSTSRQLATSFGERDFTDLNQPIVLEARLGEIADHDRACFPDEIRVSDDSLLIRLEVSFDQGLQIVVSERFFPESGMRRPPNSDQIGAIGWDFIPATRSLFRELGGSRQGVMRTLLGDVDLSEASASLDEILRQFRDVLGGIEKLEDFRLSLAEALSTSLPKSISAQSITFVPGSEVTQDPLSDVTIVVDEAGRLVPLTEQSDGIRALSVIAAYGIAHQGRSIVGIDEPENHLHPTAQRAVARLITEGDVQRIIATHSSNIIAQLEPEWILALGPSKVPRQLQASAGAVAPMLRARWWQHNFVEPLTARKVLFVEGPDDRILIESTAEQLGLDLDSDGVAVIELGGAGNFDRAYRLFGPSGFDIPIAGMVDEDGESDWAAVLGVDVTSLEGSDVQVCRADLEDEYVRSLGAVRVAELLITSGLFTDRQILGATGRAAVSALTDDDMKGFCGQKKTKTLAATALGISIQSTDAAKLSVLNKAITASLS
jgi:putative ATP-dependent endonuclease of OLD family